MGVVLSADHPLSIELAKWNKPYVFVPYPKMLYRARKRPDGIVSVGEADDTVMGGRAGSAEAFSAGCQKIVKNEDDHLKAKGQGWCDTPSDALKLFEAEAKSIADTAAHRHFEDRLMGDSARSEAAQADADSFGHVPEVKAKRKYTRKQTAA